MHFELSILEITVIKLVQYKIYSGCFSAVDVNW